MGRYQPRKWNDLAPFRNMGPKIKTHIDWLLLAANRSILGYPTGTLKGKETCIRIQCVMSVSSRASIAQKRKNNGGRYWYCIHSTGFEVRIYSILKVLHFFACIEQRRETLPIMSWDVKGKSASGHLWSAAVPCLFPQDVGQNDVSQGVCNHLIPTRRQVGENHQKFWCPTFYHHDIRMG